MIAYACTQCMHCTCITLFNKILIAHKSLPVQCTHSYTRNAKHNRAMHIHLHALPSNANVMHVFQAMCTHCKNCEQWLRTLPSNARNACIECAHCTYSLHKKSSARSGLCYIRPLLCCDAIVLY